MTTSRRCSLMTRIIGPPPFQGEGFGIGACRGETRDSLYIIPDRAARLHSAQTAKQSLREERTAPYAFGLWMASRVADLWRSNPQHRRSGRSLTLLTARV